MSERVAPRVTSPDAPKAAQAPTAYGRRLAEQGFAVLAPMNVTEARPRARLTRLRSLLGRTLWGVEIASAIRLLDDLEARDDVDTSRVGMYFIRCPRPLFAWWPLVQQESAATREPYRRLGVEDRVELELHEGGREIRLEGSLAFLRQRLRPGGVA